MKDKQHRPWLSVITGGESLVSHAGGALLVETARRSGLAKELSAGLGRWRRPFAVHDLGKITLDLAVAVALGGDAACDMAVLRAQPGVFGLVASDPTVSRLIATLAEDSDGALAAISVARATARERVWNRAGAPIQDGKVVIDLDATLLTAHSRRKTPPGRGRRGFGHHPLLGFADHGGGGGGEPVAELLRPGKAGSNTAADHVAVFDAALAQLPAPLRRPDEAGRVAVLVRTDAAGATHQFAAHLADAGMAFSLGANLGHFDIRTALTQLPPTAWTPAYQARKPRAAERGVQIEPREGAWVAELTGCVGLSAWPPGTRLILRTQRPHPGAQLRITDHDGMRVTGFLTNTTPGGPAHQLADLELRHRRHAGPGIPPGQHGVDVGCAARGQHRELVPSAHRHPGPDGQLAGHGVREGQAMIVTLRHRLIRVPARLICHAGALTLRLPPGHHLLAQVLARLRALPATT